MPEQYENVGPGASLAPPPPPPPPAGAGPPKSAKSARDQIPDTYEKMGPSSKFVEPPPPPDLESFSSSRKGKSRTGREKKRGKHIPQCVYVLYGAIALWVVMAIWTFFLYAHSVEMMNLVPSLKSSFLSFLVPSELDSLSEEEQDAGLYENVGPHLGELPPPPPPLSPPPPPRQSGEAKDIAPKIDFANIPPLPRESQSKESQETRSKESATTEQKGKDKKTIRLSSESKERNKSKEGSRDGLGSKETATGKKDLKSGVGIRGKKINKTFVSRIIFIAALIAWLLVTLWILILLGTAFGWFSFLNIS